LVYAGLLLFKSAEEAGQDESKVQHHYLLRFPTHYQVRIECDELLVQTLFVHIYRRFFEDLHYFEQVFASFNNRRVNFGSHLSHLSEASDHVCVYAGSDI
jgi:hypothetical protein